ncbi:hypothetical protein J3Q64DRAFT_1857029, partial [Phycomyces blakesleeanus]
KETREGHRIIKSPIINSDGSNHAPCPVLAFSVLKYHPAAHSPPTDTLFVCSKKPSLPVTINIISSWISTLTQMSTLLKPCPSLRSIAFDLAIQSEVPLDDVVAMGNRYSSSVFHTHYHRSRALRTNIMESVLPSELVTGLSSNSESVRSI